MATIGEMARFTGEQSQHDPNSVNGRAWLVWTKMRASVKTGTPLTLRDDGDTGYEVRANVHRIVRTIWSHLSAEEATARSKEVRDVLRQTRSAICVNPNRRTAAEDPLWWVRDTYRESTVVSLHLVRETKREARLTPAEAGEDREPAPVETRVESPKPPLPDRRTTPETLKNVPAASNESSATASLPVASRVAVRCAGRPIDDLTTAEYVPLVLGVLQNATQPMTRVEIATAIGTKIITTKEARGRGVKTSPNARVARAIASLVEDGRAYTRNETPAERALRAGLPENGARGERPRSKPSHLYSTQNPVPPRSARIAVDGVEFSLIIPTADEQSAASRLSYETALDKVMETLARFDPDAYVSVSVIGREAKVGGSRLVWAVKQMVDAKMLHVKRAPSVLQWRIRLAGDRPVRDLGPYVPRQPEADDVVDTAELGTQLSEELVDAQLDEIDAETETTEGTPTVDDASETTTATPEAAGGSLGASLEQLVEAEVERRVAAKSQISPAQLGEMERQRRALESERDDAREEAAKLRSEVARLKAAIAALTA